MTPYIYKFDALNKIWLLPYFLLLSISLYSQNFPHVDWDYRQPDGWGKFIKTDSRGNLITLGATDCINSVGGFGYVKIIKQDKAGAIIWQHTFIDSLTLSREEPFDLVIDSLDNIYIAGRSNFNSTLPPPDFSQSLLVKFDSSGKALWARRWGNNIQLGGGVNKMQLYHNKYIYVAGYMDSWQTGFTTSFILQYDSSGTLNWADTSFYNFDNFYIGLEVDKAGNAYASGLVGCCPPGADTRITKFDLSGNKKWTKIILDSVYTYLWPKASLIDDSANVYIAGDSRRIGGHGLFLTKVDSTGNQKWFNSYSVTNTNYNEIIGGVVSDSEENKYVYGFISPSTVGNAEALVTKINKHGVVEWSWRYDSLNGGDGSAFNNCIILKDSSILCAGLGKNSSLSDAGRLLVSLSPSGSKNWLFNDYSKGSINNVVQIDSLIFSTGYLSGIDASYCDDSLYVCKFTYDSLNSVIKYDIGFKLKVYPNPFTNSFRVISLSEINRPVEAVIYSILGTKVIEVIVDKSNFTIDAGSLPAGIYMLELKLGNRLVQRIKVDKY